MTAVAGVEVRRPAAGPGGVGERLVHGADAEPDVPAAVPEQPFHGAGELGGVVQHSLDLVADRALEGQAQGQVGQAGERVGHQVGAGPAGALVDGEHHDGHRTS